MEAKVLWRFLLDRCDASGFWKKDYELATFQMGFEISPELLDAINQGKERIKDYGDHIEIVEFVGFQYGTLNPEVRPHKPVLKLLEYYKSKGYRKGINTLKEQEQDKDKEQDKDSEQNSFDQFWSLYPKKVARRKAETSWKRIKPSEHPLIYADVKRRSASTDWQKNNGQFIPYPTTYLNQERWKDQVEMPSVAAPPKKICRRCQKEGGSSWMEGDGGWIHTECNVRDPVGIERLGKMKSEIFKSLKA